MRALLWTVLLAFAAWSGWWWFAASTTQSAAETAFAEARAQGWRAETGGISVAGYPSRVDLTVTAPDLATPDGRWGWRAPFVQLFALSYKPWHVIAALPQSQEISSPLGPLELTAAKLQASLVVEPGSALVLERSQIAGEALGLSGGFGRIDAARLSFATRQAASAPLGHDIGLTLEEIALPEAWQARLPQDLFPAAGLRLHLDAEADFDAPLDRHALAMAPELAGITLRMAVLSWGEARISLSGSLSPDALGRAEGTLQLELAGGSRMLEALAALGLIEPEMQRRLEMVLLLGGGGTGQPITLPLALRDGQIRLGPLGLGPAPLLRG